MIERIEGFAPPDAGTALTVGTFDGVHKGHAALLMSARHAADAFGGAVIAITFEPHPLAILRPEQNPGRLTTAEERAALLKQWADAVVTLPTTRELLSNSAERFIERFLLPLRPRVVVEGPDFHFGKDRRGSSATLREVGRRAGFTVEEVPEQIAADLPGRPPIRSSLVREFLAAGKVHEIGHSLLGRAYRIAGRVGYGQGRGGPLGFPTANLDMVPQTLPQHAVYAAFAQTESGGRHLAAVNIGPQPTFAQMAARVEAHLLDFTGDLRNQSLGLHLLCKLRDQQRFGSLDQLKSQIATDIERTRQCEPDSPRPQLIPL